MAHNLGVAFSLLFSIFISVEIIELSVRCLKYRSRGQATQNPYKRIINIWTTSLLIVESVEILKVRKSARIRN